MSHSNEVKRFVYRQLDSHPNAQWRRHALVAILLTSKNRFPEWCWDNGAARSTGWPAWSAWAARADRLPPAMSSSFNLNMSAWIYMPACIPAIAEVRQFSVYKYVRLQASLTLTVYCCIISGHPFCLTFFWISAWPFSCLLPVIQIACLPVGQKFFLLGCLSYCQPQRDGEYE